MKIPIIIKKQQKRILFYWIIIFSGSILFLELILQLLSIGVPSIDNLLSNSYRYSKPIRDANLVVRPNPKHPEHDLKGFRNEIVPNNVDIVALGDSNTYGYFVKREKAWPQYLEFVSKITTYNMAYGMYGPVHSLILWKEAKELNPKLIIEAFYAGNDLFDSYNLVYNIGKFPKLKSSDPIILKLVTETKDEVDQIEPRNHRLRRINRTRTKSSLRIFLSDYSKLFGLLRALKQEVKLQLSNYNRWNKIKQRAEKSGDDFQVFEGDQFRTVFTSKERLFALNLNDPKVQEGLRISLEVIREMHDRAVSDKIKFVVLLIPTKELAFKDIVQGEGKDMSQSYQDLIENEELFWKKTKVFLQHQGIDFIDALPVMRDYLKNYRINHDGHVNAVGHRAIADLVYAYINTQGIFKR
jgi:lysophospholipase L1-like esterase